jgi:hypothetical protein
MSIIDTLKKWFEPKIEPPASPPSKQIHPICEHQWKEYKNRDGNIQWRECQNCWSGQTWQKDHWHDVKMW